MNEQSPIDFEKNIYLRNSEGVSSAIVHCE
jgi:hypothetical protein